MMLTNIGRILWYVTDRVSRLAGVIATIAVMSIMLVTVVDVLARFIFNHPIPGSVELCQYLIVAGGFLSMAWCTIMKAHVRVDMIYKLLSTRMVRITDLMNLIVALSIIPLVSWRLFVHGQFVRMQGTVSTSLEIPAFPFYFIAASGFALMGLVVLWMLVRSLMEIIKKETSGGGYGT